MIFIEKIRAYTKKGIDRNMKLEYKNAENAIKKSAKAGKTSTEFTLVLYYENKEDIYFYILEQLKSKGFNVKFENYGLDRKSKRLRIDWSNKKL